MEEATIKDCRLLIIGGSAGSLEVLLQVLPHVTAIPFAMVIVLHRRSAEDSTLEELIAVKTSVPVVEVEDKTPVVAGSIHIAPSDYHLLFENDGTLSLDISEKVNYSRPSIDVAFESAADVYGASMAAILLSGANADGTNGLIAVKNAGGMVIVQDPDTAEMPFMPRNAVENLTPDFILDAKGLTEFIIGSA
ncbi:chemotaxis protein CheB [Flavobacterium sp. MFBS3-15]|uniref:chemotaxis protein CheB n=1 Tax=Flavobacterium sp. MFBS3-15 TaxID=2989816 RepID=UPI002236B479|nr:chemotaxis protein CheB [Flavobacterium sp. MFBS3-15]MCW4470588.1 chemotaxis protein CheB [Flavobacterium sp. MFBS3-15]